MGNIPPFSQGGRHGRRSGKENQIIRLGGYGEKYPEAFREATGELGMSCVTTTVWDESGAEGGYLFETARSDGAVAMSGSFGVAAG